MFTKPIFDLRACGPEDELEALSDPICCTLGEDGKTEPALLSKPSGIDSEHQCTSHKVLPKNILNGSGDIAMPKAIGFGESTP